MGMTPVVTVSRLNELAAERSRLTERLQQIDDEAAEIIQGKEEEVHLARRAWPHLGPHAG